MDFMDIDQIEEVPDTPERFITSCNKSNNDGSKTGNNSNGSSSCRVIDRDYFNKKLRNESRDKGKSVIFNGGRRLFVKPDNIGNSSSSKNAVENTHHDKGKSLSNATSYVDLTEGSRHNHVNKLGPRSDTGKRVAFGGQQKGENGSSSLAITPPKVNRHKRLVSSLAITPPKVNRHKRLVRNGCISPHNIAKTKVAEKHDVSSVSHLACDGPSSKVEIKDIVSEATDSHRNKGKGVSYCSSGIDNHDSRNAHLAQRKPLLFKDATDASTESDGWITTHSTLKNGRSASSSVNDQSKNTKVHTSHINRSNFCNHYEDLESTQFTKRQKEGVGSSNIRGCDAACVNNADMASSSVNVGSLTSRSRNKNRHASSSSDQGGNRGSWSDEDSTVRALQLEEDERLARELQEQLYNEVPAGFGVDEMDSHHALAMAMQQEHGLHAGGHGFHAGGRAASHSRSHASRSVSSNNRAQASTSTRLARLRGRFPGRPRTISARRSSIFPPNMDVDMRMHILETLEAFNDMELPTNLLQMGREFNENDYEMLLALDDNNHQHGGATHAQINNLPQSTVQAENLQECAICLETPNVGETIRHLPCLHKFHKDCIDEWLRRKTSCPVCKSSVT